jgi:hypothetical protein
MVPQLHVTSRSRRVPKPWVTVGLVALPTVRLMKQPRTKRILVVAPNVADVRILCDVIDAHVPRTTLLWCADNVSAISLASDLAKPPDLLLVYVDSSCSDWVAVVQQIKSGRALAGVSTLVITMPDTPDDVMRPAVGVCFVRPFELAGWDVLGGTIRQLLEQKPIRRVPLARRASVQFGLDRR